MKVDGEEIVKVKLNIRLIDCWLTSHWGFFVIIWMQDFLSICINVLHNTCNIHIGSKDIMNCQRKAAKLGPNFCAYCPWPVRDLYPATPSMSDCVFLFYYNFKWLIELHLWLFCNICWWLYPFFLLNFCAFEWYLKPNRETCTFYLFDILIHSFFRTCWTRCSVFWCRTLFLMCMTTWYLMPWWVLTTALSLIDWLIW